MPSASPAIDPFGSLSRLLAIGLIAGLSASIPYTVAQQIWVEPLLRAAETFEKDHAEDLGAQPLVAGWRGAAITNAIAGVGYGLLLAACISVRRRPLGIRSGMLWGLGGFAVLSLLPALTLPVGLPGLESASLPIRQAWWALAAICAAFGLTLLTWAPKPFTRVAGGLIAMAPPIASHLFGDWPETPPELRDLQTRFGVAALATSALFWITIGTIEGLLAARGQRSGS